MHKYEIRKTENVHPYFALKKICLADSVNPVTANGSQINMSYSKRMSANTGPGNMKVSL